MKTVMQILMLSLSASLLLACSSVPEGVKDDGREAAERAKAKSREAYKDLENSL